MHYRRPAPATSVRYSLRIDTAAIAPFLTTATRQVQLFSASAANLGDAPHMLQVILYGQATGSGLRMYAACASQASHVCSANQPLTQNVNVLRFQINVGAGTAGSVRYWINADFTDPPTGVDDNHGIGLDNAASGGVIAAELGLSSATPVFRTNNSGAAVVFDQIQTSDDVSGPNFLPRHSRSVGTQPNRRPRSRRACKSDRSNTVAQAACSIVSAADFTE